MLTIDSSTIRAHSAALLAFGCTPCASASRPRTSCRRPGPARSAARMRSKGTFERAHGAHAHPRLPDCRLLPQVARRGGVRRREHQRVSQLARAFDGEAPEAWLGARELADVATRSLAALGELERQAVLLCDVQELERDQTAGRLGITRGHLRVLFSSASTCCSRAARGRTRAASRALSRARMRHAGESAR
jgi:hypothetical protein